MIILKTLSEKRESELTKAREHLSEGNISEALVHLIEVSKIYQREMKHLFFIIGTLYAEARKENDCEHS